MHSQRLHMDGVSIVLSLVWYPAPWLRASKDTGSPHRSSPPLSDAYLSGNIFRHTWLLTLTACLTKWLACGMEGIS